MKSTLRSCLTLAEADLARLGVPLDPRQKLLKAIAVLRRDVSSAAAAAPWIANVKELHQPIQPAAERRQITVMFCDLVGSTAMSARLDPEDLREVLGAFQSTVTAEITRFDGCIAKYMGDGVLAYFGWPQAHEDDAERAVRAGLALVKSLHARQCPAGMAELEVRVGIATGLVVVGDLIGAVSALKTLASAIFAPALNGGHQFRSPQEACGPWPARKPTAPNERTRTRGRSSRRTA
jgi:class 3 adenylate cyclase